jgi:hypothetical protein
MSTAASFPSVRNQGMSNPGKSQTSEGECPLASRQLRTIYKAPCPSFALRAAMWNLYTTQPNTLLPTYDDVVNLTGLLETKGMSVSSGKQ